MKMKIIFVSLVAMSISGCFEPYDYSGSYVAAKGNECNYSANDRPMITITKDSNELDSYTATLSPRYFPGDIFPKKSITSQLKDDSLIFTFHKEGKSGFFSVKPDVNMKVKMTGQDDNFLIIEDWLVTMSVPESSQQAGSFDFVKDPHITMLGKKAPNMFSRFSGDKGLCMKNIKPSV